MNKSKEFKFVIFLMLLHAAIALPLAWHLNIWMDEASTLYSTQHGLIHTIQNAFRDEKQAPLYFIILSVWRGINDSIFFARLFSIISSLLAIKFFYDLTRKFLEEKKAIFITTFFAVHPFLFWASLEIRVYSLLILLSILLLKLFFEGYVENSEKQINIGSLQTNKTQIFYFITAFFALCTNYYLGFFLVAGFIALLVMKNWQIAKNYFMQMAFLGLLISPFVWIFSQQFFTTSNEFIAEKSSAEALSILAQNAFILVFPIEFPANAEWSIISIIRVIFLILTAAAIFLFLFKNKFRGIGKEVMILGVYALVVAAFLMTAYFLLGWQYIAIRHMSVWFVPLFLFFGLIISNILPRKILLIFAILLTILFPYTRIYKQYSNLTKRGDWANVAEFIEKNEEPNQPLIVFQTYEALALPYYYKGKNKILPDEKFFDFGLEGEFGSQNSMKNQIKFVISEIPPDADEIWLMTTEICQIGDDCLPLENFVKENYTVIETKDFYKERVRLLKRK